MKRPHSHLQLWGRFNIVFEGVNAMLCIARLIHKTLNFKGIVGTSEE
jgi:hypothetical protein